MELLGLNSFVIIMELLSLSIIFVELSFKSVYPTIPLDMRRRSDVSLRSHIGQDFVDHTETSSWRRNWYMNETDPFETSLWRLIGT